MPNFYIVDSNIIMGYCNPEDYLYEVSKAFFNEKPSRQFFLLFTVREEFLKKIEKERAIFFMRFMGPIRSGDFPRLQRIIQRVQARPAYQNNKFLKYILSLFEKRSITHVSFSNLQEIFNEYDTHLKREFDELTQNWIRRPHMTNHTTIFNDQIYLTSYHNLKHSNIHDSDARHLALAAYEVRMRNRRNRNHQYFFYTDDRGILNSNVNTVINISNFFVKKIPYDEETKLGWNPQTNSFSVRIIDKRIYRPNGL